MPRSESKLLTEVELLLMNILWRLGEGTVREVLAEFPAGRTVAYTSASTMIRILEQKGAVESRKEGKAHIYKPILLKKDYENKTLDHVIENVFDGTPAGLVRRLVSDQKMTKEQKAEIRRILKEEF